MSTTTDLHIVNNPSQATVELSINPSPQIDSSSPSIAHHQYQQQAHQPSHLAIQNLERGPGQQATKASNPIQSPGMSHNHLGGSHQLSSTSPHANLPTSSVNHTDNCNQVFSNNELETTMPSTIGVKPGSSPSQSPNLTPCAQGASIGANDPLSRSHNPLSPDTMIPIDDTKPAANEDISAASLDPTLDEDAPHEEDDGVTENESSFMSFPVSSEHIHPDGSIDFHLQSQHDSYSAPPHSRTETQLEAIISSPTRPSSTRKRKRPSEQPASTPRRPSSRPKQVPRVKSAEQLATEALIEQQNPHATKNELRSLKLRALHAVRIAERELNMPEAEKQRRLRLREYVRQKRAEERKQKSMIKQAHPTARSDGNPDTTTPSASGAKARASPGTKPSSQTTKDGAPSKNEKGSPHQLVDMSQSVNPQSPLAALDPNNSPPQSTQYSNLSICSLVNDPRLETPSADDQLPTFNEKAQKANRNGLKTPRRKPPSRPRGSVASLEAELKKQNPEATEAQLKSLKLRALHADRIAEREQNMSEREKTRRQKLREYMRRRRDEGRAEKSQESIEANPSPDVNVTHDSPLKYRGSLDSSLTSESQVPSNDNSMPGLVAHPLVPEGMNADDRLAAFSMMELNSNYQHQYSQSHQSEPSPSLHLHPLFQIPMDQASTNAPSAYDCSVHPVYPMTDAWSQIPLSDPPHISGSEVAQKALHAAIQDAIYMKPHNHHQIEIPDPHQHHLSANGESFDVNKLARIEQERIRIAEEEILGIERARELAMIAAAAAEVERAHQMPGSTSHL